MSRPESLIILIGCVSCAIIGAAQTLFAILLAKMVAVSDDQHDVREDSSFII